MIVKVYYIKSSSDILPTTSSRTNGLLVLRRIELNSMETERAICCSFFFFACHQWNAAAFNETPAKRKMQLLDGLSRGYFTSYHRHLPRLMISSDCPPQSRLSDHCWGFFPVDFNHHHQKTLQLVGRSTCFANEEHWTENAMRQPIGNCAWSPQNKLLINGKVNVRT